MLARLATLQRDRLSTAARLLEPARLQRDWDEVFKVKVNPSQRKIV